MAYRSRAFAFVASSSTVLLLAFGVLAAASLSTRTAYAQDDLWYVGEGVQQDMYVKYRLQEFDTNNGRPYEMTIYFKEQQDGDWIAPAFVVDQGRVIQGTLKLGDNLAPLGGSDIPAEMRTYVSGYRGTLQWLEAFTTKTQPLSLSAPSWGKIAAIGGEEMKPQRQERVTVQGGTFDTTVVGWHKGKDNMIWVANGFPFPVKAETYVEVTTGQAPIQSAYELLETGTGQPEAPVSEEQGDKPGTIKTTGSGSYSIELNWEPETIQPDTGVVFGIIFYDKDQFPLDRVNYDFTVKDSSGNVVQELRNQNTEDGTGQHELTLNSTGAVRVTVKINSVSGTQPSGFIESTDFDIVVVPEFPVSAAIVAGIVVGMVVLLARSGRLGNLAGSSGSSLFGGSAGGGKS